MRPHRHVAFFLALAAALSFPGPWDAPAAAQRPARVRFTAPPGGSLLVHGTYPEYPSRCLEPRQPILHARYRGTIEVGRASDGTLFVIGTLRFEDYLKGIAEVPRSWPFDALKAQVVAARSYAMVRLARGSDEGRALGYDLCATDACQVYLGMGVEEGPWGDRWVQAVEETEAQVLLYQGRPAETLYFSTSHGRTLGNDRVFGSSPLPYLRGIRERDDGESPLSRWRVRMPFDDLARFLNASGLWPGGRIRRAVGDGDQIRLRGAHRLSLSRAELRSALNSWAGCLKPSSYPPSEPGGYRLPQTVPSIWYGARQEDGALVLEGRGWGHGVGMVQWGAKGKADRGLGYEDILARYYGGLRPQRVNVPGRIRVLIADGLRSVTVVPSGEVRVRWRRKVPKPPWHVVRGSRLRLGRGAPPSPLLEAERARTPRRARSEGKVRAAVTVSRNARVRLEFLQEDAVAGTTAWVPVPSGRSRFTSEVPALPSGRYEIRVAATDGVDRVLTGAAQIRVLGGVATTPTAEPSAEPSPPFLASPEQPGSRPASRWVPVASAITLAAGGLLLVLVLVLTLGRRKGLHRGP